MELVHAKRMSETEKYLGENAVDILLLDLGLPDTEGMEAVRRARAAAPRVPLVVLTCIDDESVALQALREGAQDYLVKGQIEARGLLRALHYAVERKILEDALFEEKERAQATLNCIGDAVICMNSSGHITFLNAVTEKMTGWLRQEAEGRPMTEVFRVLDATSCATIPIPPMGMAIGQNQTLQLPLNCILIRHDGVEVPIEGSIAPIHDRQGKPTGGAVFVSRDVSAARATSLQISHSAEHDFLTGLPNRMLLNDRCTPGLSHHPTSDWRHRTWP
jgi:PAS domain-containing protein